jgi:hypothetical protein
MKFTMAFNTGDMETFFGLMDDNVTKFGPREGVPRAVPNKEIKERAKQANIKYHETHSFRSLSYKPDFRVIGNTGLVWELVERTIFNKKSGITQRLFLKCSYTYVKSDGKWIVVLYHESSIPSTQTLH